MYGWWLRRERGEDFAPVRAITVATATTGAASDDVKVTAYVRKGHSTLLALASFAPVNVSVRLSINFTTLGLTAADTKVHVPQLMPMQPQPAHVQALADVIEVQPQSGWLLILSH
jgi:hypothetical protein